MAKAVLNSSTNDDIITVAQDDWPPLILQPVSMLLNFNYLHFFVSVFVVSKSSYQKPSTSPSATHIDLLPVIYCVICPAAACLTCSFILIPICSCSSEPNAPPKWLFADNTEVCTNPNFINPLGLVLHLGIKAYSF